MGLSTLIHLPVVASWILESHLLRLYSSVKTKTTSLECVFVQPTANHIPLRSDTVGNRPVDIDGCKAGGAEVLERHTVVLGGHIVPLC